MENKFDLNIKRCLFLWLNVKEFHAVEAARHGVEVEQVYKRMPTIMRFIRRIQIELNIRWISPWVPSWKKKLSNYETVIIHASKITPPVVQFIRRKNPTIRIIVWYWNPIDKCVDLEQFCDNNCEIWSFDEMDCKRYGLNYNTQYYFNDVFLPDNKIEFDVFFVGGDKGRIKSLIKIQENFKSIGISSYFNITNTGDCSEEYKDIYKERITYQKVLEYISKSRAIMDYVSENQSGLTLRPLEALFMKKKLITNDKNIRNIDFYHPNNIFILGLDKMESLPCFIIKPYMDIDVDIIMKYDFSNWIERFFK